MLKAILLLSIVPIVLILARITGRKYEDLTDEEKEIYHRIEKENERRRPAEIRRCKEFKFTVWPLSMFNEN
jgi:hypothetical protein